MPRQRKGCRCRLFSLFFFALFGWGALCRAEGNVELAPVVVYQDRIGDLETRTEPSWEVLISETGTVSEVQEILLHDTHTVVDLGKGVEGITTVSLRGFSPRHTRVMVEGVAINSLASGYPSVNRLPFVGLERIQFLTGGPSTLWGAGLGGVMNFRYDISRSFVEGLFGKDLVHALRAGVRFPQGWIGLDIGEGYPDVLRKDRDWKKGLFKGRLGEISLFALYSQGNVSSGVFSDDTWERDRYRDFIGKVSWDKELGDWDAKMSLSVVDGATVVEDFADPDAQDPYSRAGTSQRRLVFSGDLWRWWDDSGVKIGWDAEVDSLDSVYLSETKTSRSLGIYGEYTTYLGPLEINAGLRGDRNWDYQSDLSGHLGLKWAGLRMNLSRAVSSPPLLWRYYDETRAGIRGNPDIAPEKAWVYSVEWEEEFLGLDWTLGYEFYRIEDALAVDRDTGGHYFMRNYRLWSQEIWDLGCSWQGEHWGWRLSLGFSRIKDEDSGEEREGVEKFRFSFEPWVRLPDGWEFRVAVWLRDSNMPSYYRARDNRAIVDVYFAKKFERGQIFFAMQNALNEDFWQDYFYPLEKRRWQVGVRLFW